MIFVSEIYGVIKVAAYFERKNILFLPSSAPVQAPAGLCWFYYQLLRPADRPTGRPTLQNSTLWSELDFPVKSKVVSLDS